jgi:hypothetical protein
MDLVSIAKRPLSCAHVTTEPEASGATRLAEASYAQK